MGDLFSEESLRARLLKLKAERKSPPLSWKTRLDAFAIAAMGSVAIPIVLVVGVMWVREQIGPRDEAVVFWWPELGTFSLAGVTLGVLSAVVLGIAAFRSGKVWPLIKRPWIGLAVAGLIFPLLSLGKSVSVYPDRVVSTASRPDLEAGVFHLRDAAQVEVGCSMIYRRRRSDIATIDYAVVFPDGQWVNLSKARPSNHDGARAWFKQVDRLDRAGLGQVPKRIARPGVGCLRALRSELGEADFLAARRMLSVDDRDFLRVYAEPHEAWNRKAEGADTVGADVRP